MNKTQTGFSVAALIVAIIAVGVVCLAAWRVYEANRPADQQNTSAPQDSAVQEITSQDELDQVEQRLDSLDVQSTNELDELDAQLAF
jgi:predicted negative regulator of RcsB-dependent stress response